MCGCDANVTGNGRDYWVECESCLTSSNYHENRDTTIAAWNRRTTPDRKATVSPEQWQALVEASQKVADSAQRRADRARATAIEEIAEMVDHMGEGRRLEEYVEAIRGMKS